MSSPPYQYLAHSLFHERLQWRQKKRTDHAITFVNDAARVSAVHGLVSVREGDGGGTSSPSVGGAWTSWQSLAGSVDGELTRMRAALDCHRDAFHADLIRRDGERYPAVDRAKQFSF